MIVGFCECKIRDRDHRRVHGHLFKRRCDRRASYLTWGRERSLVFCNDCADLMDVARQKARRSS